MGRCVEVPYEKDEQTAFVQWCHLKQIPVHHSGNEIGGSTRDVKIRAIKMKKMGTSKGFWDLVVFVPIKGITGEIDAYQQIMIEMKRQHGGTMSTEQKKWQKIYETAGIPCKVCKGAKEAIAFVEQFFYNKDDDSVF